MWPQGFEERLGQIGNIDLQKMRESMQMPRVRAARAAECKADTGILENAFRGQRKVPWENAWLLPEDFSGADILHRIGAFYVQEPSAMLPVAAMHWARDWKVLDLCAAPGGKTHQLLCRMTQGMVWANEINPARARILLSNTERTGASRAVILNEDPARLEQICPAFFDAILVDAPCSGEGMFRRDEEAVRDWSPAHSDACAVRQRKILESADRMLKENGYLVYATCTFSRQENEDVVGWFMEQFGYRLLEPEETVRAHTLCGADDALKDAGRYVPYLGMGEGQFFAVLQKRSAQNGKTAVREAGERLTRKQSDAVREMLDACGIRLEGHLRLFGDTVCWLAEGEDRLPSGMRILRAGTAAAVLKKDRAEPHHHFFSAMGNRMENKLDLELQDPLAAAYLRGEELPADRLPDGYAAVRIGGIPAGGVRIRKGRAKNLYPKGLRA